MPAAFVLEELQHVQRRVPCAVLVGQNHDGRRADEGAVLLQDIEIERHVAQGSGQKPRRWAARLEGLEAVAVQHAARRLDQVQHGGARGQKVDAWLPDAARKGIRPEALASVPFHAREDLAAFPHHPCDPVQCLDVVHERRTPEDADLGHKGRAVTGQAALAFDRLDHRAFFAADVGASAPAKVDVAAGDKAGRFQFCDLTPQDFQNRRIFVAHVDEAGFRLDRPGRDQHAFQKKMRCPFEIEAVLERSRFALVAINGKVAWTRFSPDKAPLPPGREARAAEAANTGIHEGLLDVFEVARGADRFQSLVSAGVAVGRKALIVRQTGVGVSGGNGGVHLFGCGVIDMMMPDLEDRRGVAAPHAGRAEHPHFGRIKAAFQCLPQLRGAHHFTRERVADADRQRRRRGFVFFHDIEVGVERRDLVDFGHRQAHLFGQGAQMRRRKVTMGVLDQVQEFDQ